MRLGSCREALIASAADQQRSHTLAILQVNEGRRYWTVAPSSSILLEQRSSIGVPQHSSKRSN